MFKCTQKYIERFYSKITIVTEGPEKGCWKIDYCCNKQGYAIFNNVGAHRFMYLIWHQDEEEKMIGLDVCHTCDNRWCVNPDHLWLGTNEENMKDMVSKNRQAKGSKHGRSVLNENIINEILSNILNGKLAKITKIADIISDFVEVNHNYKREHKFNLWFVVNDTTDKKLQQTIN